MHTLTQEFQDQFGISEVITSFSGGQKTVWIVKNTTGKKMAIKSFTYCSSRDIQEIELLKKLSSLPGIPKIIKTEEYQGKPLLFEEFIDAPDLEDILSSYKGDPVKISVLLKDIIIILKPVWEDRIVHRDLKPKNIKILLDGKPVILDFGIARDLNVESITSTGGWQPKTWNYASPEQFANDKDAISYRTDFFCLGLIAYQLHYQCHPFGNSEQEVGGKFANGNNLITLQENDPLNPFFDATLGINPSSRARTVDVLLSTL